MFCTRCGKELPSTNRFCTSCGAAVFQEKLVHRTESACSGSQEVDGGLKAAVELTKTRSRRYVHAVILTALTLALAMGVAYAICRVYAEVVASATQGESRIESKYSDLPAEDESGRKEASIDCRKDAYEQYKRLLGDYANTYGGVCVATPYGTLPSEHSSKSGYQNLSGLCFAYLVDFDQDDLEELVCAYYDENLNEATEDYRYIIEVWRYDMGAGRIQKVFSVPPCHAGNNAFMYVGLVDVDGRPCVNSIYELENIVESEEESLNHRCVELRTMERGQEEMIHSIVQITDFNDEVSPRSEIYIDGCRSNSEASAEMQLQLYQSMKSINQDFSSDEGPISDFPLTLFESEEQLRLSNTVSATNKTFDILSSKTDE